MKVILKKNVESLGSEGDIIQVKGGYARNFLIPRGLALPATGKNIRYLEELNKNREKLKSRHYYEAEEMAERINNISVTIAKPVGEQERLFGTVTHIDIAEALAREGLDIDRRKIIISEPIKSLGIYNVIIKLHQEVQAQLKVWVVKE